VKRETLQERPDWREKFDELGFHFHSSDGRYWDERVCYEFTADEVDVLEAATEELHAMCLSAVGHVIAEKRFRELAIPEAFDDYIVRSWRAGDPTLFGRFDFSYDGAGPPKLLEYNADTPTSLIEAAVAQWNWQQEVKPDRDQFNSLHEKLIDRWKEIAAKLPRGTPVHFSCVKDNEEDLGNLEYLRDTALQAGLDARLLHIEDIGWDATAGAFVDLGNETVRTWFKLYPWEWMVREQFGTNLPEAATRVLEPPWKMLLANKAILAILWDLFPGHPNLLAAYLQPGRIQGDFVEKPLFSREGANVTMHAAGSTRHSPGTYGAEGFVYQAAAPLPNLGGGYAVVGSWIVGDKAAGMGLREDFSPITRNTSRFVPHYF
jgi:glutathionylspermidine synthase